MVLKVFDLRQKRFERRQLLVGPAHAEEVDIIATLTVVFIALLELYIGETVRETHGRRGWERRQREGTGGRKVG